ncbi:MAG: hypothetical protein M1331_01480 [Candidatus Marsarchaeota archaeon]|nr:hypothetical protein [Candidatus Marsarchaeota archaeon]
METKKIIRNTLIGAGVLIIAATASGCGSLTPPLQEAAKGTAKQVGTTIPEIKKVERNPFAASCSALRKSALYEMQRGEIIKDSGFFYRIAINHEVTANNLLKIYSMKRCDKK